MATLVIGAGLVGSQVARQLVEEGETPVLMDVGHQRDALAEILPLDRVRLVEGDVLRPFALTQAIRDNDITDIIHTAANPLLTLGAPPIHVFTMVVVSRVPVDGSTSEELLQNLESADTARSLGHDELWSNLPAEPRCRTSIDVHAKAALSVDEPRDPAF